MVTVDMSTTRAQITKRQRRMRRAAHLRSQRHLSVQLRQLQAAKAARQARQRAVEAWHAEEERLQRLRETQQTTSIQHKTDDPAPQEKPRSVKFAAQVLVTEIPVRDAEKLPKPVPSPIGVSICGTSDGSDSSDSDDDNHSNKQASRSITFSQLPDGAFPDDDDDDDPEFSPDDPLLQKIMPRRVQRPRRRIAVKRLDVSLEQIIPAKRTNKSKLANAPKRPRRETRQSSTPSCSDTPSPSIARSRSEMSNPQTDERPAPGAASEQQKQCKRRDSSNDVSSPVRLKTKRKRLRSADIDNSGGNENGAVHINPESRNKAGSATAKSHEYSKPRQEKSAKCKNVRSPLKNGASIDNSETALQTDSSTRTPGSEMSSVQNGQVTCILKNSKKSSTPVANGHSKQNGHKLNGFHDKLPKKQSDKARDADGEKDLDNLFGELVKKRAAKRAAKEHMSLQTKRIHEANGSELITDQPNKKKFKKGPARYTKDGLRIMTYEEIAADQPSGLNGDCPFDCSCCF